MQIHEITEGFISNMARGFASGVTGIDIPQSQASINRQAAQAAQQLRAQGYTGSAGGATERIVVSLQQPEQSVPSKYYKTGNIWTNELGAVITNPKTKAYLDSVVPTHGRKETIAQPAAATQPAARRVSRQRSTRGSSTRQTR